MGAGCTLTSRGLLAGMSGALALESRCWSTSSPEAYSSRDIAFMPCKVAPDLMDIFQAGKELLFFTL